MIYTMIIVHTESGSIYEFDHQNKRVRRLHGERPATSYQGDDGEWKNYINSTVLDDNTILIIWNYENGVAKTTKTSLVTKTIVDEKCYN